MGFGIGLNLWDNATAEISRDTYIGQDNGEFITGNIITSELSVFDLPVAGDTYNNVTERDGQRVSSGKPSDGPFDMIDYPETESGNIFNIGFFSIKNNGDLVVSVSASAHFIFGGHVYIGLNLTEFFERLFE